MNLTAFAVRRWQVTLLVFMLLATLGVSAFLSIPRSVDPHFPISTVVVTVILPGADAADMEETVAKPLEDVLQGLDHIREIRSTSTDGAAVLTAEFEHGTDAEQSLDRVVREVNAVRDQLPQGIQRDRVPPPAHDRGGGAAVGAGQRRRELVADGEICRRSA